MNALIDNFRLAFGTFLGNPLRSLLTLLGIVIGVATVVSMMGLIEGLKLKVNRDLTQLGANVFEVSKRPSGVVMGPGFDWRKYQKRPDLTLEDLRAVQDNCPSVSVASATQYKNAQKIVSARAETKGNVEVIGGTAGWSETNGVSMGAGRFFVETEDLDARDVVVLGTDVADTLFPNQDPVGGEIRVKGHPLTVVGVLQRRGSFMGMMSMDNQVVIPLRTMQRIYGSLKYMEIDVQARDAASFTKAQDEVIAVLRRRRAVAPNEENNFEITTNESNYKMVNDLSSVITVAGVGVCLLSLVVGGIGILNIMLVSVMERTKEIGIRKALGARKIRILAQFATEAVVLAMVGGVLGLLLGFGISSGVRWVIGIPTVVPPWAVALALFMSSGVGLLFGIYPAARAARLDPVEAMRAE